MSVLELKGATIRFGGLTAVKAVDFTIEKGDLFGLIGPNGAGKTTCFNMITGVYKPTEGNIIFNGRDITGTPANKIAQLGIARTFQNIRLFGALSAVENVMVGAFLRHHSTLLSALFHLPGSIQETKELREQAMELLKVVKLQDVADSRSCDLPYGKQRRLEIARAMATKPELLLLDEPAAGMNPQESEDLMETVRRIRDEFSMTVLLIEHDMRFVMNLCEKIVVLNYGQKLAEGGPADIRNNPQVVAAYLGTPV